MIKLKHFDCVTCLNGIDSAIRELHNNGKLFKLTIQGGSLFARSNDLPGDEVLEYFVASGCTKREKSARVLSDTFARTN